MDFHSAGQWLDFWAAIVGHVLSWPVAAIVITLVLLPKLKPIFHSLAKRRWRAKGAGMELEVESAQYLEPNDVVVKPNPQPNAEPTDSEALRRSKELGWYWAKYWHFRMCDFYLQLHTKYFLKYLSSRATPLTNEQILQMLSNEYEKDEIEAVIGSLSQTLMIREEDDHWVVTPYGTDYIERNLQFLPKLEYPRKKRVDPSADSSDIRERGGIHAALGSGWKIRPSPPIPTPPAQS